MCGIFGKFSQGSPLDPELCREQTDTLAHRGPDGAGYFWANSSSGDCRVSFDRAEPESLPPAGSDLFLGHRRLAVLDLSPAAAQPMSDPTGRYWIVFNGEIYNFAELRRELEAQGVTFRTSHSDTEVLLMAYCRWGEECLARLRGMFAFAVLDLKEKQLFLARDRLGKKPLYYRVAPEGLAFASELKALLADPGVPRELNPAALAQYLAYGYIPAPGTIYQGIDKLPPAHLARISLSNHQQITLRRYWDLPVSETAPPRRDWREEFQAELTEAVRLRMISDVPLGAFASGGLDSTLIIRQMRRVSPGPVRTFAIGFPEAEASELPWARRVARRYNSEHFEQIVRPDAVALLPRLVRHFDEPFGDSSALPTLVVSEMARQRVTVALSGDGGDELLAGYTRYRYARWLEQLGGSLPEALRPLALKTLARFWPRSWRGKGIISRAAESPHHLYRALMARPGGLDLLNPDVLCELNGNGQVHGFFDQAWEKGPEDFISRLQYVDFHTYLPEDILVKTDRASMSVGLELRCPLLDHRVVELAARLPQHLKFQGREQKVLIKQLLLPDLGPEFVHRRKNGFQMPLRQWFAGNLGRLVTERLADPSGPLAGLCSTAAVAAVARRFIQGQQDLSEDLWRLLVLSEWMVQIHSGGRP
ncbi:MAG: asparagine synthase (glutamine-hydrolyzing) [Thermodesulfobacteriota bacterium]